MKKSNVMSEMPPTQPHPFYSLSRRHYLAVLSCLFCVTFKSQPFIVRTTTPYGTYIHAHNHNKHYTSRLASASKKSPTCWRLRDSFAHKYVYFLFQVHVAVAPQFVLTMTSSRKEHHATILPFCIHHIHIRPRWRVNVIHNMWRVYPAKVDW